ncbi:MAG TPA: serine hydrolase [Jatrophihabitantaceae bacterium]|nr:serine hydrolase [Jatrophihabitantaceae bacterium]
MSVRFGVVLLASAIAAVIVGLVLQHLSVVDPVAGAGGVSSRAVAVTTPRSATVSPAPSARPRTTSPDAGRRLRDGLARAAYTAAAHDLRAGIAVLDLRSGRFYGSGETDGLFGTGSVVKVMIAARLLIDHELTGATADLAYSMITRSDDDAANVLWGKVGGPSLEPWIAAHYGISRLGAPNTRPGRWGNTHVTPRGLVQLYAKLRTDPTVWPWLGDAMRHASRIAKDGTDQFFGIPAAISGAAVKQGWADGSADNPADAIVNTTGFVDHDRYAVAILTEGNANNDGSDDQGFNADQAAVVTTMARLVCAAIE